MESTSSYRVHFTRESKAIGVNGGTILDAARKAGIAIESACGGQRVCGKCRVRILQGILEPVLTDREYLTEPDLQSGVRLACAHPVTRDLSIETLPPQEELATRILEGGVYKQVNVDCDIVVREIEKPEILSGDSNSDVDFFLSIVANRSYSISLQALKKLPELLRNGSNRLYLVVKDDEIVNFSDRKEQATAYAVAIDLGTTTIVSKLTDLSTGKVVATTSGLNRQQQFGHDVISRVSFCANNPGGVEELQQTVISQISDQIDEVCAGAGIQPDNIYKILIAGNTVMLHLFWGISPVHLAQIPFRPVFRSYLQQTAGCLLKVNPSATVATFPLIGGYVGGDSVAVLLTLADDLEGPWLAVDIGTNGEILLAHKGRIYACSTAAGPAFEGVHISSGMRAVPGAISGISIVDGRPHLSVIGDSTPRGFCGSGIIDAIHVMLQLGVIDSSGRIINGDKNIENGPAFRFSPQVYLTQKDIREVQLAKGAIATGIAILLKKAGLQPDDLKALYLAGAFGNFIKKESAVGIGLVPDIPLENIHFIGNAACAGAELALISREQLKLATGLAEKVQHVEISNDPDFQDLFAENMFFREPQKGAKE